MTGRYFRCGGGAVVREILSQEAVLNRKKLGERPYEYEVGNSISDTKNSLCKGPEAGPWLGMFKVQQGGQNG